jgi:hypothetical protein
MEIAKLVKNNYKYLISTKFMREIVLIAMMINKIKKSRAQNRTKKH